MLVDWNSNAYWSLRTNKNANRLKTQSCIKTFQDSAKQYMRSHNVPPEMQRRVQRWYDYSWSRGRMSGAGDVHSIKLLPDKLKTELALHVNLGTLKKVKSKTRISSFVSSLHKRISLLKSGIDISRMSTGIPT